MVNKAAVDLSQLERPFTLDEIKGAVFNLGGDKAPAPDGFPMQFFKQSQHMIKGDLVKLCEDFYLGKINLEMINWTTIALIPKVHTPRIII